MVTLAEYAPHIGIALFVLAIATLAVRFRFPALMPAKITVSVFTTALLAYTAMGVGLRLHEDRLAHPELTVGDIARPVLTGSIRTDATAESWQEAIAAWIDAVTVEPPEEGGDFRVNVARSCPVMLLALSAGTSPNRVNDQLTISQAELC